MEGTKTNLAGQVVYLSGPCSGYPDLNKALFEQAEATINAVATGNGYVSQEDNEDALGFGITVVHPHQEGVYENLAAAMQQATAIVMLPGWARKGGTVEDLVVNIGLGHPVFYFDPTSEPPIFTQMSPTTAAE